MSQWTHLAGIIRLDSMGNAMVRWPAEEKRQKIVDAVERALGYTCNFESSIEDSQRCTVPTGSEGSLQYRVSRNSDEDEHALSWGYIAIWGDLRDFGTEDVQGIVDWFQKSLERLNKPAGFKDPKDMTEREKAEYMLAAFMIRDAVLSVSVEYSPKAILLWDDEAKKVLKVQDNIPPEAK